MNYSEESVHEAAHGILVMHFGLKLFGLYVHNGDGETWNEYVENKLHRCAIALGGSIGCSLLGFTNAMPSEPDLRTAIGASLCHELETGSPLIDEARDTALEVLTEHIEELKTISAWLECNGSCSGEVASKIFNGAKVYSGPEPKQMKVVVSI